MRFIKILCFSLLLFNSCKNTNKTQNTSNQQKIADWYKQAQGLKYTNYFLLPDIADSIAIASKNEVNIHKAMSHIVNGIYFLKVGDFSSSFKAYSEAQFLLKNQNADSLEIDLKM